MKERKAAIRKEIIAIRDIMLPDEKEQLDKGLCAKVLKIIQQRNAKVIHTYLPFGSEIDVYPLIELLLAGNYIVVCPKSLPKGILENLTLKSLAEIEEGRFGTKHPAGSMVYTGDIDLFIVPGVAFDGSNHRLGYGAGYYDRFFATQPKGYKLGLCYPFQVLENIPVEPHDMPLDAVIY